MTAENREQLIEHLNRALSWELRALAMYAHYAAYVSGIHRLHLSPMFQQEALESMTHAATVREAIVRLGGVAVTATAPEPIEHSTDYRVMLEAALATERVAADTYATILKLLDPEDEMFDALQQIHFAEVRSESDLARLL